jgi:hypothetical protein
MAAERVVHGEQQGLIHLRQAAWMAVGALWCYYAPRNRTLKQHYGCFHENFFADVHHFWIERQFRSLAVHFRASTVASRLCVGHIPPHQKVVDRGGFHARNGHQALFCFGQGSVCFGQCFDCQCKLLQRHHLGNPLFNIPQHICAEAITGFVLLDANEELENVDILHVDI